MTGVPGAVRALALLLGAVIVVGGCAQSRVDPDADISLTGSLARQDGAPAGGVEVILAKEADLLEGFSTVVSLGLFCLVEELPSACGGMKRTQADDEGRFAFSLKGRDGQGTAGTASWMHLAAALPRGEGELDGPGAEVRLRIQTTELELPVRFWEPEVQAVADARTTRVSWTPPTPDLFPAEADLGGMQARIRFESGDGVVWEQRPARSDEPFDARLIEDAIGAMSVTSGVREVKVPDARGDMIDVMLRSPRFAFRGTAGVPVSRGKGCSVPDAGGTGVWQAGCRLTDGDYAARFEPTTEAGSSEEEHAGYTPTVATVDLGATVPVTLVVVRGCPDRCLVEASADDATWQTLGAGEVEDGFAGAGNLAVALPAAVAASKVRITAEGGVGGLRELSVWDDSEPSAVEPVSLLIPPEEARPEDRPSPGAGTGTSRMWLAVAALLALAVAAVVVLRRRAT